MILLLTYHWLLDTSSAEPHCILLPLRDFKLVAKVTLNPRFYGTRNLADPRPPLTKPKMEDGGGKEIGVAAPPP